jgi:hypothetical protein
MKSSARALLVSVCLAGAALAAPVASFAAIGVTIDVAPPPVRVEALPPPRVGFVWAPGFWEWQGRAHVWVPGRWVAARPGFHWVPDRWVPVGPHWRHAPGHWER